MQVSRCPVFVTPIAEPIKIPAYILHVWPWRLPASQDVFTSKNPVDVAPQVYKFAWKSHSSPTEEQQHLWLLLMLVSQVIDNVVNTRRLYLHREAFMEKSFMLSITDIRNAALEPKTLVMKPHLNNP
ncbi:uncharacterized protein [Panulirus ornatus]|uniref:uncharacterized protein n=1 Tax=Panulirus ornatus TaxID=150431 RepID=UPI003A85A354